MGRLKERVPRNRSYFPYAVAVALSVILVVLAWLQYRWSNQVSRAERDRMEASLHISTTQFQQDFVRALQNLCFGLQPDSEMVVQKDWSAYAAQSSDWLKNSSYPELASAFYLWQPAGDLLELNRKERSFHPVSEPASLQAVLGRIKAQADGNRQVHGFRPMAWQMEGTAPALVRALVVFDDPEGHGPPDTPVIAGYAILLLNRDFIQSKFLPELAVRHFGGPSGFLYQVGVFSGEGSDHPVYQSSKGLDRETIRSADSVIELIEPRTRPPGSPEDGGGGGPGGPGGGPPHGGFQRGGGPPHGFSRDRRPPNQQAQTGFDFRERIRMARRFGLASPTPTIIADARSPWRLVVRHRAGSVDAAVASLRIKNLAISFAILLLLAASIGLIVVSTQRAQRLARLQVEFVAGVSHELRTPLAVIASASDNLTAGIVEDKNQVKLYGSLIRSEARRLEGMMKHILEFAAGQNRRIYDPRLLSVDELIDRTISLCNSNVQEAHIQVEKRVSPGLAPVLAEENGLMQCLQNLVTNAVKYGGPERWIGIEARMEGNYVLISVKDRGIGIEPEDLPYLFDAFYRGKSATDAQIHGTGLGLSLAKSFAQAAGGTISVTSEVGEGSCFTLKLPAAKPEVEGGVAALTGQTV